MNEGTNMNEGKTDIVDISGKVILDPCCGSRMMWVNREHPQVLYTDYRELEETLCDGRTLRVKPDAIVDARKMPFPDNSFYHVACDPPHLIKLGENSWMCKKYSKLDNENWKKDIRAIFDECLRVLKPYGTLTWKWSTRDVPSAELYKVIPKPLYGTTVSRNSDTLWLDYVKGVDAKTK